MSTGACCCAGPGDAGLAADRLSPSVAALSRWANRPLVSGVPSRDVAVSARPEGTGRSWGLRAYGLFLMICWPLMYILFNVLGERRRPVDLREAVRAFRLRGGPVDAFQHRQCSVVVQGWDAARSAWNTSLSSKVRGRTEGEDIDRYEIGQARRRKLAVVGRLLILATILECFSRFVWAGSTLAGAYSGE